MPILPRVEPTQVQVGVPRGPRENAFTEIGKGLGEFGEAAAELQKSSNDLWLANAQSEYVKRLDSEKDNLAQSEPDPMKRIEQYPQVQAKVLKQLTDTAPAGAGSRLEARVALINDHDFINYKHQTIKDWDSQRVGDFALVSDKLAKYQAESTDPIEAASYDSAFKDALGALTGGRFPAVKPEEAAKLTLAHDRKVDVNYGNFLINNGNFDQYYSESKAGRFSNLSQEDQYRLDVRADQAITRNSRTSRDLKKGQIEDAVDGMASRVEAGERPEAVWADLSRDLKSHGLFGVEARQRFDQLVTSFKSPKGEDSEEYNRILDGFEKDRQSSPTGIPSRGTVAKWQGELDKGDLGIEAKRKVRQELNNWNTRRAQFEQTQQAKEKTGDIKRGEDLLKESVIIPPRDPQHPNWDEIQAQKNQQKTYTAFHSQAMAEGDRSGDYFAAFKRVTDQIKAKNAASQQKQDALKNLSPAEKEILDRIQKGGK